MAFAAELYFLKINKKKNMTYYYGLNRFFDNQSFRVFSYNAIYDIKSRYVHNIMHVI